MAGYFFGEWWRLRTVLRVLCLLCACMISPSSFSVSTPAKPLVVQDGDLALSTLGYLYALETRTELTFEEALQAAEEGRFTRLERPLSRGYTNASSWLYVDVAIPASDHQYWWDFDPQFIDYLAIFTQVDKKRDAGNSYHIDRIGDQVTLDERAHQYVRLSSPLNYVPELDVVRVFFYLKTSSSHLLLVDLVEEGELAQRNAWSVGGAGGFLILTLAMAMINLVTAVRLRERVFAIYGLYLLTLFGSALGYSGLLVAIWPGSIGLIANWIVSVGVCGGFAIFPMFVMRLFHTAQYHPVVHGFLWVCVGLGLFNIAMTGQELRAYSMALLYFIGIAVIMLAPYLAYSELQRGGGAAARFFLIAFSIWLLGTFFTFASVLDLIPATSWSIGAFYWTSLLHMIFVMLGFADRLISAEQKIKVAIQESEATARLLAQQMTQELADTNKRLQVSLQNERDLQAGQGQFIDTISHEFRTPLSIMRSVLDIIAARKELADDRISTLNRALKRLNDLFDQSIKFSKGMRERDRQLERVGLVGFVKAVIANMVIDVPVEWHNDELSLQVAVDLEDMRTVITNLCENAERYRYVGGEHDKVIITFDQDQDMAILRIANDVSPNAPALGDEMFKPYVRGGVHSGIEGLGLGLNIVRRIMHAHEGTANILKGNSTEFVVELRLPLARA